MKRYGDSLIHAGAALALTAALSVIGAAGVAVAVALIFVAREAEQAEAKLPGSRWRFGRWSAHRHIEWAASALGAALGAMLIETLRRGWLA